MIASGSVRSRGGRFRQNDTMIPTGRALRAVVVAP
jgi:hypothetical protein